MKTKMLLDGEINHYVKSTEPPPLGICLKGEIDWERRYKNMRLHSAGHLVDFAMFRLGYSPNQPQPFKADHGKKPCIFYDGVIDKDIREELEIETNLLVQPNLQLSTRLADMGEVEKVAIYVQPGLPKTKIEAKDGITKVHYRLGVPS